MCIFHYLELAKGLDGFWSDATINLSVVKFGWNEKNKGRWKIRPEIESNQKNSFDYFSIQVVFLFP